MRIWRSELGARLSFEKKGAGLIFFPHVMGDFFLIYIFFLVDFDWTGC